jgi:hypothetical protein
MEQKPLSPPYSSLRTAKSLTALEQAQVDLIFVQDLGLVPKRIITPSSPRLRPAAERKWLGADFSHVIVSHKPSRLAD